jgi:phospholipid transport system substrate-binding protein
MTAPFQEPARAMVPLPSRRRLLAGAVALAVASLPAVPAGSARAAAPDDAAATAARDLIAAYQAALLDVMQRADALGIQGRAEALDGPVRATFDFDRMARAAAGKAWRSATEAQRATMVDAFAAYSVAVHADRFDGYGGERFVIDGTAPGPAGAVLVHTHIARPDADPVALSYVVAPGAGEDAGEDAGGAAVMDVLLKGSISEVALRRSEWADIGRREGLPGLVRALSAQTDRMLGAS